jgi:hypothetical protein
MERRVLGRRTGFHDYPGWRPSSLRLVGPYPGLWCIAPSGQCLRETQTLREISPIVYAAPTKFDIVAITARLRWTLARRRTINGHFLTDFPVHPLFTQRHRAVSGQIEGWKPLMNADKR